MSKSKAYFVLGDIACKGGCSLEHNRIIRIYKQVMGLRKPTAHMRVIGDEGIAKPPPHKCFSIEPETARTSSATTIFMR